MVKKLSVVLLLLRGLPCFAQQGTTAELTGRVASAGQALPGVTVTLTSDSLQGGRVTVTGQNGGYLFALLPPADYVVHFDLQGFTPAERRVRVSLAATTRVDVELGAAPLQETVTIESDSARVPANASVGRTFRISELERLPGGRDIHAAVLLSPSASAVRNRLTIAGAPSWDSLFLVDGVVVNENLSGQPHNLFIEDSIQEIAVLTEGIPAEYGRFTGGVVSTLTKSGGNEFSGSLRDTMRNAAWTQRTPWRGEPHPLDKLNHGVEGTLGGFLAKDRLWFFAAARKAQESVGRFTTRTNIAYGVDSHDARYEGKLTGQITARHSLVASYVQTSLTETNVSDSSVVGVLDLPSLIPKRSHPTRLIALTDQSVLGLNTFSELHYSRKNYALLGNGGRSSDPVLGTVIGALVNLNAPYGCGICGADERDSSSWSAKASHYTNTRWGNHTTVVGAERFHEQRINNGNRSASQFSINNASIGTIGATAYPHFNSATLLVWTPPFPGSRGTDLNTLSAHVSDQWDVTSRVTLNVGLRYDRNNARDAIGRLLSNDNALSPRLSAMFDLRNDGRHRLVANYGRYTAKIFEAGGRPQQLGVFSQFGWRYGGPEINPDAAPVDQLVSARDALARLFAWFDSVGGVGNRQFLSYFTDPTSGSQFVRSLKSPAVHEWSLGYAIQMASANMRVDYVARDWHNFYAARVDTTTGQRVGPLGSVDIAWVVNDDSGTVRRYRGVQLQGAWHHGGASAGGGYTFSRLRGNDDADELTAPSSGPRNLPLSLWYPEFLGYPQRRPIGYLSQDRRHRVRLWVGYEAAAHRGLLSATLLQWFDSGRPYSAVAAIDPTGNTATYPGVPTNPGYALNQISTGPYFFSKRGAFRTDNVFSTDVALKYEIPYGNLGLFLKGDILNLLNNAAVVSPGTEVMTRFTSGLRSGLRAFNPFSEAPVEGVHYRLSPDFGKPTGPESYQAPRSFQLSFGARF